MTSQDEPSFRADLVQARLDQVLARYPGRFSPAELEQLRVQIAQLVEAGEQLRAVRLANGDEPAPVLRVVRPA